MSHLQAQRQQQQLFNHQHNNGWQYAHPFAAHAAAFNAAGIPTNNAYNNVASTAQTWENGMHQSFMNQQQANVSQNQPKVAIASEEIKLTRKNKADAAKLPVAFGFWLDDDGSSKQSAQTATESWKAWGQAFDQKALKTPNGKKMGSTPKASNGNTPKTPRTPALLLSTEPAPKLPDGWVAKTFQRTSGATAGTKDTYFYSPQRELKFRSMKACNAFVQILNEPGIDDEQMAFNVFKSRGHKV